MKYLMLAILLLLLTSCYYERSSASRADEMCKNICGMENTYDHRLQSTEEPGKYICMCIAEEKVQRSAYIQLN